MPAIVTSPPRGCSEDSRSSRPTTRRAIGLPLLLVVLLLAAAASLRFGANPLSLDQVWHGFWHPDDSEASLIVWQLRVPRTIAGALVGAAFGVAGALIQALTRNPLADPGILGVNAGAGFAVTLGVGLLGVSGVSQYVWCAFAGAALTTVAVYLVGSAGRGPVSPLSLVLAGVALGAVLGGFTSLLTLVDEETFDRLRRWGVGSLARVERADVLTVAVFLLVGLVIAFALAGALNSIAMGDDLAAALGANVGRTRVLGVVAVTLLAGGATALTGGIGFVGLMVPHVVRWFVGPDQRWILTVSAPAAAALVLAADVTGRVIGSPGEIEVGIVTAVLGAPVLIALVRRSRFSGL